MTMDIGGWLQRLGLERYEQAFRDNEVDFRVLPELTADDLKELGVTAVGHRRLLLKAIADLAAHAGLAAADNPVSVPAISTAAEAERRQLTVMFCDLVGSTPLATRFDPEDLRDILGAYHRCVAATVDRFDGFVAKYMGDGALVYFGYPRAHEEDAERAVRAGLALIDAVANLDLPERLLVRIGIASGLVVVGDLIGAGAAQERGVVGETPNLAARLQGLAAPGQLIIAEATRRLIGALFDLADLGAQGITGFAEPQPAWLVIGESGIANRFEALRSLAAPLIGRDEELDLLLRRWRQASAGEGRVVLLSGEPGIGKSRLSTALTDRIDDEPHTRLRYFCSPHHQDSALHPFILQLERAAGFVREDSVEQKLQKLGALLVAGLRDDGDMQLIAELLSLPNTTAALNLSPQRKLEKLFEALMAQLAAIASATTILMVFEDAHWIDPTSRELLDLTVDRIRRLPVLLVVTFRPEFQPVWTGQAHVTTLALNRLGEREAAALVRGLAGNTPLGNDVVGEIIARTDGVPLFVEELTAAVLERAGQDRGVAAVLSSAPLQELGVPATLHASLISRLDRIGIAAKEVAQIGAVLGREFSYEMIEAVAERGEAELHAALAHLADAGLLFCRGAPPHSSYLFKHALVQDAAYGTLLRARRRELHARVGRVIEERLANPSKGTATAEEAALAAHHWLLAEEWEKAFGYTLQAAEIAQRLYARPEAIARYWQALDLLEKLDFTPAHAQARVRIIITMTALPGWQRDEAAREKMLRHIDRAIAYETASHQLATLAQMETIKGQYWEDEALLVSAVAHAEASGDASAVASTTYNYGIYLGACARFEESLAHVARGIEIRGALGDRLEQGWMMAAAGRCFSARAGKISDGLAYAARAREVADELSGANVRAWCAMEAEPYMYKGLWHEVVRVAEDALPLAWEIHEWGPVYFASAWLAIAYVRLGQPARAKDILDRIFAEVPARALDLTAFAAAFGHIAFAELHLENGNHEDALEAARLAIASAEKARAPLEQGAGHRLLGQAYAAKGAHAEADASFRRSLEILEAIQCPPELAQTLLAYGRFRRGDNVLEDRRLIERALSLFATMEATGWIAEARAALG